MKRVVFAIAAAGVLSLTAGAFAQVPLFFMGGKVMSGDDPAGTELHTGAGGKPADCPTGHFYTTDSSQQRVMKCDDDTSYTLEKPAAGDAVPEGAMVMKPAQ